LVVDVVSSRGVGDLRLHKGLVVLRRVAFVALWLVVSQGASGASLWPSYVPTWCDSDSAQIVIGLKFRAIVDGQINGVRFYKCAGNTGTHSGKLWTSGGSQLASVTFSGETATGWQYQAFSSPVAITAGVTYVVSYYAPVGRYASFNGYFTNQGFANGDLYAFRSSEVAGGNGVYRYGGAAGFPNSTYQGSNYFVDVDFSPAGPVMVLVPSVVASLEADARAALVAAGLVVGLVSYAYSETVVAGRVISQSPVAGSEVEEGSVVDLVVSLGPAPVQQSGPAFVELWLLTLFSLGAFSTYIAVQSW